jgi:hypothetical protein
MENNVIKLLRQMEREFMAAAGDSEKFVEGNNSAGTRVRKCMQSIKKLAQEVRVEIQDQKHVVAA